jgi:DNA-binding transcriptional ArsR family regulator
MEVKMKLIKLSAMSEAAECLKILAHPIRLRMVEMLFLGDFTVGEIADACGIQSHMASEHLGKMKDKGLLSCERRGRSIYYSVANPGVKGIMTCIESNFGKEKETYKR